MDLQSVPSDVELVFGIGVRIVSASHTRSRVGPASELVSQHEPLPQRKGHVEDRLPGLVHPLLQLDAALEGLMIHCPNDVQPF